METSDDPNILNVLFFPFKPEDFGLGSEKSLAGAARKRATPDVPKVTAEPEEQISETARRNRRRRASLLTAQFTPPKLGLKGLLGVGT